MDSDGWEESKPGQRPIRLAFLLPGLGRVRRGAETAFYELATRLSRHPGFQVTSFGLGHERMEGLNHVAVGGPGRERFEHWPRVPALRDAMAWEELWFTARMRFERRFRPSHFDIVLGCSYPWINWSLRKNRFGHRPKYVHVTQNGDWPVRTRGREYRFFGCDGLVCVSPEQFQRCQGRAQSVLIGNGVDIARFHPVKASAEISRCDARFDELPGRIGGTALPGARNGQKIVLVSSALTPEKRVDAAIRAVACVDNAFLAVAGDGPLRQQHLGLAERLIPGRYALLGSVPTELMPALYRRADMLLHLNPHEPFGIVYLEAAASGLPVAAPDVPTTRWILGEAALYFETPDDPAGLAHAISQAIFTRAGRALGRSARSRVEGDWSWDSKAAQYARFLTDLHSEPVHA